ncbi:GNAT superfamily N-acetyltransferase [Silvibacterium bohemicum]|uniref:GNAT superfamily N-acetyltransferase n=1 Tax=Silvibacterium bohemicum TaxID=1577686 RepID=A0A841K8A7_9BACT|nr:GNAT family N-acetyltransferase [Silvibacterium bohemicum]MBB6147351.1 GNAT superfamily N-acetyltransferase [Silvibacterium bohemicum]
MTLVAEGLSIRRGSAHDVDICSSIFHQAFSMVNSQHGFPSEVPTLEDGKHLLHLLFLDQNFQFLVAEMDGRVIGSVFLDERTEIIGIGPISVGPDAQFGGIGRMLMIAALDKARQRSSMGIRLMQASFNVQSLSLYAKLGFAVQEPMAVMAGLPIEPRAIIPDRRVRVAVPADLAAANNICRKVYGFDRSIELKAAIERKDALVVEHKDRIAGYASGFGYLAHAVCESALEMQALLSHADRIDGTGIFIPTRNRELFHWCLENGMRVIIPYTHMTIGSYIPPNGAYIPSVHF